MSSGPPPSHESVRSTSEAAGLLLLRCIYAYAYREGHMNRPVWLLLPLLAVLPATLFVGCTRTVTREVLVNVTAQPSPSPEAPTVSPSPQPVTVSSQPQADRASCGEIRGTEYRSETERAFFLANCTSALGPTSANASAEPSQQPAGQPAGAEASRSCFGLAFLRVTSNDPAIPGYAGDRTFYECAPYLTEQTSATHGYCVSMAYVNFQGLPKSDVVCRLVQRSGPDVYCGGGDLSSLFYPTQCTSDPVPVQKVVIALMFRPPGKQCDPSYPDFCIAAYPPDLECSQVLFKRFKVLRPDPHNFDVDRDDIGCELN